MGKPQNEHATYIKGKFFKTAFRDSPASHPILGLQNSERPMKSKLKVTLHSHETKTETLPQGPFRAERVGNFTP